MTDDLAILETRPQPRRPRPYDFPRFERSTLANGLGRLRFNDVRSVLGNIENVPRSFPIRPTQKQKTRNSKYFPCPSKEKKEMKMCFEV